MLFNFINNVCDFKENECLLQHKFNQQFCNCIIFVLKLNSKGHKELYNRIFDLL